MSDTGASGDAFTFSAFMSYARHDRADAVRLQRRLEQYRLDADLRVREGERFFPARPLQPVFRDEDELVPGQDLPERIRKGLESSRFLIVLASRASLKSQWVEKEILDFMTLGKAHRIIVLVIDGVPNAAKAGKPADLECLPRPFRLKHVDGRFTDEAAAEPNWVDWRGRRKNDRINFLRLVSALLGLDRFDDLVRRDARAERNRLRLFQTATAVFVAVGLAAVGGAFLAADQLNAVRTTESKFLARLSGDLAEPEGDALKGDHARALQLAIEGAPTATNALYPRPLTVETETALRRSTSQLRLKRFLANDKSVHDAAFSPDGLRIVTLSRKAPFEWETVVRLWDARSGKGIGKPTSIRHDTLDPSFNIAFADDGTRFMAIAGGAAQLFDAVSGTPVGAPIAHQVLEVDARFSPDGLRVATEAGGTRLWDARTGASLVPFVASFANRDLTRAAEISAGRLRLFDVRAGKYVGDPIPFPQGSKAVGFSTGGARLLIINRNEVSVWDANTGAQIAAWSVGDLQSSLFSADGTRVLTAARAGTAGEARWWDTNTGKPLAEPMRQPDPITAIQFSPDFKLLATLSGTAVRLWDAATGAAAGKALAHEAAPHSVLFSNDGARLATLSAEKDSDKGIVTVWDVRSGDRIGETIELPSSILTAAFSSDGRGLMIALADSVHIYDAATGALAGALKHDGSISSVSLSPDGTLVLTSSDDASVRLWDARPTMLDTTAMRHAGNIRSVAISPDGTLIATGSEDKTARLWRAPTGAPVGAPMTHGGAVEHVAFSADGSRVVTLGGEAHLWDAKTGKRIGPLMIRDGAVSRVMFSADGSRLVTLGGETRLWDAKTGKPVGFALTNAAATDAAFSADGKRLATVSADRAVRLWDAVTASAGPTLQHTLDVTRVSFSPDGSRLLTVSGEEFPNFANGDLPYEVRVWDVTTAKQIGSAIQHVGSAHALAFSADGARIATTSEDATIVRLWDARTGAAINADLKHPTEVVSSAFSPDGLGLLTVDTQFDFGGRAHLWNAGTGAPIAATEDQGILSAKFSADGSRIATGGWVSARLWDGRSLTPIALLPHSRVVLPVSAIFIADGKFVATSGPGITRLWDGRMGTAIGTPLPFLIAEDDESDARIGKGYIVTSEGAVARAWNIADWSETGAPLIARACAVLDATGIAPLPQNLRERAFRPGPTRPCAERGLLDWRFYFAR